jgi:hypothetical protein
MCVLTLASGDYCSMLGSECTDFGEFSIFPQIGRPAWVGNDKNFDDNALIAVLNVDGLIEFQYVYDQGRNECGDENHSIASSNAVKCNAQDPVVCSSPSTVPHTLNVQSGTVAPTIQYSRWTPDEEMRLLEAIVKCLKKCAESGAMFVWSDVANEMHSNYGSNRSICSCSGRWSTIRENDTWTKYLSPEDVQIVLHWSKLGDITRKDWSIEEKEKLIKLVKQYGTKWVQIAKILGRTEYDVKILGRQLCIGGIGFENRR